jgi:GTPase SAR1 family protein
MSEASYQVQKQNVLNLFQAARSFTKEFGTPVIDKNLLEAGNYLDNGKLCVVVCGEYKQGKSSLTNALLETNLFPVDIDITTSAVTTITYGEIEKITVVMGEQGKSKAEQITRSQIPEYVTEKGNPKNYKQVKLLSIESPNPKLKDGLVIADTPGVGGLNTEHTAVSYAFIPNADVVLFVSDALSPLSTDELSFIDRIKADCENLIFVVTKIDKKADYQTIVKSNREKLAKVLECPQEQILIIPVSSELKKVYLQHQNIEDLEDSNFATLEKELWQYLNRQGGYILIMRSLTKLRRQTSDMYAPLKVEWDAYQQKSQADLAKQEREFQEQKDALQELLDGNAQWRNQLARGLLQVRQKVTKEFQTGFITVRNRTSLYLDNERLLSEPPQIASLIETDIDALMTRLQKLMGAEAGELQAKIELDSGLNLSIGYIDLTVDKADRGMVNVPIETADAWQKGLAATQGAAFKGTAGTTLGGVVGGVVGGAIGFLFGGIGAGPGAAIGAQFGMALGGIAGATQGMQDSLAQVKQRDKSKVSELILPFLSNSQTLAQTALNNAVDVLKLEMEQEFTTLIQEQKSTGERKLKAVQNAQKMTQAEMAAKSKILKEPVEKMQRLLMEIDRLAQVANAQRNVDS